MEQRNNTASAPRKMRFAPKAPPRRAPKLEAKTFLDMQLHLHKQHLVMEEHQLQKKSSGLPKGEHHSSTESLNGGVHAPGLRRNRMQRTMALPMRRPYSGNPELLDKEFASENITCYENSMEPAGLMEEKLEPSILFFQLPPSLPMIKQAGYGVDTSSGPVASVGSVKKTCGLEKLPARLMGKMLVYKSGAVKMIKLLVIILNFFQTDAAMQVNPGSSRMFSRDVVAVNAAEKQCCIVGELDKRAVLTPNVVFCFEELS
ncbi:hypothetical protein DITRI_Ditri03aG0048000 [Diplodiscus trichospermus]